MAVDLDWARRNLDPEYEAPHTVEATRGVEHPDHTSQSDPLLRELIEFDSQSATGEGFRAASRKAPGGLSDFVELDWPEGLAPKPGEPAHETSLPTAEVLIVTWTVDEAHALSRVLTPGLDSRDDWYPYRKNFDAITAEMRPGAPARQLGRLGSNWTNMIGKTSAVVFKSDSHMSQDGPKLVNARVWRQILDDVHPRLVLTTGTGGGIGNTCEVGDVIVSRFVSFDCQRQFISLNGQAYACPSEPPDGRLADALQLFAANAGFLPHDNTGPPRIVTVVEPTEGVLTTDFFGFDNSDNTYGLQGKGELSEMGDAVLGMVCAELGKDAPAFAAVRNVSDPQISSAGFSLAQQTRLAADIYKAYGLWSSVCSAIVCWALTAAL